MNRKVSYRILKEANENITKNEKDKKNLII